MSLLINSSWDSVDCLLSFRSIYPTYRENDKQRALSLAEYRIRTAKLVSKWRNHVSLDKRRNNRRECLHVTLNYVLVPICAGEAGRVLLFRPRISVYVYDCKDFAVHVIMVLTMVHDRTNFRFSSVDIPLSGEIPSKLADF